MNIIPIGLAMSRYTKPFTMKILSLAALLAFLIVLGCEEDHRISEVPAGLTPSVPCPLLAQRLQDLLPRTNCMINHPILFNDTIQKRIVISKETEVYVTYIEQSALYENTFGWYSYAAGDEPARVGDIKREILFPNVTEPPLKNGDMMQVGKDKFPAGTVIEFFLITQGWQNGVINYNGLTLYTESSLNPNGFQQHILFKEKDCGNIVLGFEDILQSDSTNAYYDNDFNDAIFTISDNNQAYQTTAFDVSKMAQL